LKPTPNRPHFFFRCASFIACSFVLSLLAVSSGATNQLQQTPNVTAAQQASSPGDNGALKFAVTVTGAKGGFIVGLTKENFSVWEGKTEREINYFNNVELPASVGVFIDVSGSMKPSTLEAARYAAARFIQSGNQRNEYLVAEFSDIWRSWSGWRQDVTAAIEAVNGLPATADKEKLQAKQKPRGQTALYDACAIALDEVAARPNSRHVLLLITDGHDNSSRLSLDQLRKKIKTSNVQIYGIGVSDPYDTGILNVAGQTILDELATVSGGRAYYPSNKKDRKELDEVIDRIVSELSHQYVIGFTPTNAAPAGKWNKVRIKLAAPDESLKGLSIRTREGYFSPAATP
jgi:Ca-activated chloride channel family protein